MELRSPALDTSIPLMVTKQFRLLVSKFYIQGNNNVEKN